jgi:3-phenylpropionate/cinnamic acid dioxygenase small subunit
MAATASSERVIANLIARYAELTDDGDFDGLGEMMAGANFSLNGGTPVHGAAAVTRLGNETLQTFEDGTPKTRHVTTNVFIDVDEESGTAVARSYFTVFQSLADFPLQAIAAGRYRDRFTRADGTWAFAERHVISDFFGDTSHHVKAAAH